MTTENRDLAIGDTVTFLDYAEAQESPSLVAGESVIVVTIDLVDQSVTVKPADGRVAVDTAFDNEITLPAGIHFPKAPVPASAAKAGKITSKAGKASKQAELSGEDGPLTSAEKKAAAKANAPTAEQKAETKAAEKAAASVAKEAAKEAEKIAKAAEKAVAKAASDSAKSEAAKLKAVAAPTGPAPQTFEDSESVMRLLEGQDALDAAKSLIEQKEQTYFDLGGVLYHIHRDEPYRQIGYDGKRGFSDYLLKELDMGYRKAMDLISIYKKFRELGVSDARLAEIGWSKAKKLANVVTPENFDELVDVAKNNSRDQLEAVLSQRFESAGDGTVGTRVSKTKFSFSLFEDQAADITRALDAAKMAANTEDMNQALHYALVEWTQTAEGMEVSLEQAISQIQIKYGVSLVVAEEFSEAAQVAAE